MNVGTVHQPVLAENRYWLIVTEDVKASDPQTQKLDSAKTPGELGNAFLESPDKSSSCLAA